MKRKGLVILLVLAGLCMFCSFNIFGQFTADPNDRLYRFLSLWEAKGYIDNVPPIRPYPPQLLKRLLTEVRRAGERHDRRVAEQYYSTLFPHDQGKDKDRLLKGALHTSFVAESMTETEDIYWKLAAHLDTLGSIGSYVAFTGNFAYSLIGDPGEDFYPERTSILNESQSGGGVLEVGSREIDMSQLGLFGLHFGTDWIYFQAGLMRTAFGPFYDNGAVLGPQAPASGHFSFSFQATDWLTISSVYLELVSQSVA